MTSKEKNEWLDSVMNASYKPKQQYQGIGPGKKRNTPERDFQASCLKWFRLQHSKWGPYYFMIKQESYSMGAGMIAKRMGLRHGVADMQLALPRRGYHTLWIELKWDAPWTDEQKQFKADVSREGSLYVLVRKDFEKFQKLMNWYLL